MQSQGREAEVHADRGGPVKPEEGSLQSGGEGSHIPQGEEL